MSTSHECWLPLGSGVTFVEGDFWRWTQLRACNLLTLPVAAGMHVSVLGRVFGTAQGPPQVAFLLMVYKLHQEASFTSASIE